MGKIILIFIIIITVSASFVRPWIGILAYYLLALLGPQYIWWWVFEGLRVSLFVVIFTLGGIIFQVTQNIYNFEYIKTRQNLWLLLLWIFIIISYYFGPYVSLSNNKGFRPDELFDSINKIFFFYFCASLTINDIKKSRYLSMVFIICTIYLIYWANIQYLTSNWSQFNMGRLMGPASMDGSSIYNDENAFAMLFVTGLPFIYYIGFEISTRLLRYVLWCVIPLGFHAVFLTGSRGGILGLGTITLVAILKTKNKLLLLPFIPLLIIFYQWQAGSVMKQRSETIIKYDQESSAETRFTAWKGGLKMIETNPITGVGLGSFVTALPLFIESKPRVAHNTLIQFSAESGIGAGICYLMILYIFALSSRKITLWCRERELHPDSRWIQHINNACTVSFSGLIVCSLFLSLNTYEIFFFLIIINNSLNVFCLQNKTVIDSHLCGEYEYVQRDKILNLEEGP